MKILILLISFWFITCAEALGCSCAVKADYKTQEDLNEYDFISLVRIVKIDSFDSKDQLSRLSHLVEFDIIEKYKGEDISSIIVSGSHWSLKSWWTSCDLGENINDEWIIFGYTDSRNNRLTTGMCSSTFRYKDQFGYRNKGYGNETAALDKLRDIFDITYNKPRFKGKRIEFYPSGQIELEEFYKNNNLDGLRLLWYPNGQLEGKQQFENGKLNGISLKYSRNGQLLTKEKFKDGFRIDTTTHWYKVDTSYSHVKLFTSLNEVSEDSARSILSTIRISNRHIYNENGELINSCNYSSIGFLYNERIYYPKENKTTVRFYHDNGTLMSEMYTVNNREFGIYREWNSDGELIKSWEYDENGKQIVESIKIKK